MWCKTCNLETNEKTCPVCGTITEEDIPIEVYWCSHCKIPVIKEVNQIDKEECPLCGGKTKYLSADLRPVFPEERLLLELLLKKNPNAYIENSIWAANNQYYIDGKSVALSSKLFQTAEAEAIAKEINVHKANNSYIYFDQYIQRFIEANSARLYYLKDEAFDFVKRASEKFDEESVVISFSGGKDSTVTADVAIKALSNPSLVHIFGDTTLEFPTTMEYGAV